MFLEKFGKISIVLLCTLSFMIQCKSKEDSTAKDTQQINAAENVQDGIKVSGVPGEFMSKLLNECTGIDYTFKELPFSVNLSDTESILTNIGYLDINKPITNIPPDCKPMGRKFFKLKGGKTIDADIYLNTQCKFYVIIGEDGKPLYANAMTEVALKNYANIAQQARQSMQ